VSSDPVKEIRKLKATKQRIEALLANVSAAEDVLAPLTANSLRTLLTAAKEKVDAAKFAASEAFKREPLPQAGSETWKALWEAARQFSTKDAYPGIDYPNVTDDAVCVLCQQLISADANARLTRFETFVQEKVQHSADEAKQKVDSFKAQLLKSIVSDEALANTVSLLRGELDRLDICKSVIRCLTRARVRARRLVKATNASTLPLPRALESIQTLVTGLITDVEGRIIGLEKVSDREQRQKQEKELHEFEDRVWLEGILPEIEAEIARLKVIDALNAAIADTDTSRITRRTTDISKTLVTNKMRDAFAAEAVALAIADRRIELTQESSGYGSTRFKVSLIRNPKAKVANVLSDGEHGCVALVAFLAELSTAQNKSTIVFDDPVCSLGHRFRGAIAKRLCKEAALGRQVIVFTHDIPFLMMLDEEMRSLGQAPHYQSISQGQDRAGICAAGAPSKAQPVPEIADKVMKRLDQTQALYNAGKMDEWSEQVKTMCGRLRDGWESAAEGAVAPVFRRFSYKVHTGGLLKLTVLTDHDCTDLNAGYAFCCTFCHTDPVDVNRPAPTPDKMRGEIERLKNWFDSIKSRQDQKD